MPVKYSAAYETEGQEAIVWVTDVPVSPEPNPQFGKSIVDNALTAPVTLEAVVKEVIKNAGFFRENTFVPYHAIKAISEVKE